MEKLKLCGTGERRFGKALLVWQEDGSLRVYLDYRGAYGLGERFDALNQKGRRVVCEVEEKFCFQGNKSYCPAPFFWTDSGFGLYAGTCETTVFDFREGEILAQLPEGCEVTLFSGTPEGIISEYISLFGPQSCRLAGPSGPGYPPTAGAARRMSRRPWPRPRRLVSPSPSSY